MKKLTTAAVALAASTSIAAAGGIDRSGQSVGIIFEDGNYAQFSFGNVNPTVSGTYQPGGAASGDISPSYNQFGGGVRFEFNDNLAVALIVDQPWGALANYPVPGFAATQGLNAEVTSTGITGLVQYRFSPNFSIHGGARYNTLTKLQAGVPAAGTYSVTGQQSSATGYVIGGAYEIPDIALRLAVTYSSETTHDVNVTESSLAVGGGAPQNSVTRVTMPRSINVDFQTGIAQDTLLLAGLRYVGWSTTDITPAVYRLVTGGSLVDYTEDTYTWSLGVGRRFTDRLAGSATIGWERAQGGNSPNLGPTDGNVSLGIGASYSMDNMEISGGVRYVKIGDATTVAGPGTGTFTNNSAIAVGMQVGFSF